MDIFWDEAMENEEEHVKQEYKFVVYTLKFLFRV